MTAPSKMKIISFSFVLGVDRLPYHITVFILIVIKMTLVQAETAVMFHPGELIIVNMTALFKNVYC